MTKLCARGKAAAKRKFKVYPSAYANAYASKICAGKIKDPSGTKRKDWGPKKANKGLHAEKKYKFKKDKFNRQGMEFDEPLPKEGTFRLGQKPKAIQVYQGKFIKHDSGDINLSNESSVNYYGDLLK